MLIVKKHIIDPYIRVHNTKAVEVVQSIGNIAV
jgi:hypothetical protein